MAGRAAKSPENVLETLGKSVDRARLVADYKYDGERTQVHLHHSKTGFKKRSQIDLFSRNFDRQNSKFWHFKALLERSVDKRSPLDFIIDGEIVYLDR